MRSVAHGERSWGCDARGILAERCRGPVDLRSVLRRATPVQAYDVSCAHGCDDKPLSAPPSLRTQPRSARMQIQRWRTHTPQQRSADTGRRTREVESHRVQCAVSRARKTPGAPQGSDRFPEGRGPGAGDGVGVGDHNRTLARRARITTACVPSELDAARQLTVAGANASQGRRLAHPRAACRPGHRDLR